MSGVRVMAMRIVGIRMAMAASTVQARLIRRFALAGAFAVLAACSEPYVAFSPDEVFDGSVAVFEPMLLDLAPGSERSQVYLGVGWGDPENNRDGHFVWATDIESEIIFPRPETRDVDLTVRCRPFGYEGAPEQEVRVELNGHEVGRFVANPGWHGYDIGLPPGAFVNGMNRLVLRASYAVCPSDVAAGRDSRTLAFAVREFAIAARGLQSDSPGIRSASYADSTLHLPCGARVVIPVGSADRGILRFETVSGEREDATIEILLVDDADEVCPVWSGRAADLADETLRFHTAHEGFWRLVLRRPCRDGEPRPAVKLTFARDGLQLVHRPAGPGTRPDVYIYLVDALRADHLRVYDPDAPPTPHLDRFAADAVVFENAIAPSTWTLPSIVSLLSGRNVKDHRVGLERFRFDPDSGASLVRILAAAGYRSAAVSHSHVAGDDFCRDMHFDEATVRDCVNEAVGRSHEFRSFVAHGIRTRTTTPMFWYLHAVSPHAPYAPAERFRHRAGVHDSGLSADDLWPYRFQVAGLGSDTRNLAYLRGLYEGEVQYADEQFGRFVTMLKMAGLYESSLIAFVSDHGEEFGEHRGYGHGRTVYSELMRVPLLVKHPANRHMGQRVAASTSLVDVVPIVCNALGIDAASGTPVEDRESVILSETRIGAYKQLPGIHLRALLVGHLKCVENFAGIDQFNKPASRYSAFDLNADPDETSPVAEGSPQWLTCRDLLRDVAPSQASREPGDSISNDDQQVLERLRALGYID